MQADPAVAGAVLKKANSAHYGASRKIADIQEGITRIGFDETRKILIGLSVIKNFDAQNRSINFTRPGFWEHSLACGILASHIARATGMAGAAVAFVAGLLHDIGKIILDEHADSLFEKAVELADQRQRPLHEMETEVIGFTHGELGYQFVTALNLSEELCQAVRHHNLPHPEHTNMGPAALTFVRLIACANALAKAAGYYGAGDCILGNGPEGCPPELTLPGGFADTCREPAAARDGRFQDVPQHA